MPSARNNLQSNWPPPCVILWQLDRALKMRSSTDIETVATEIQNHLQDQLLCEGRSQPQVTQDTHEHSCNCSQTNLTNSLKLLALCLLSRPSKGGLVLPRPRNLSQGLVWLLQYVLFIDHVALRPQSPSTLLQIASVLGTNVLSDNQLNMRWG